MTFQTIPDTSRLDTVGVTPATERPEYDPDALLAEIVIRFEHAGLLPKDQRLPDPRGAHDAAEALLKALGVTPVDMGMARRIAKRVAALGGVR
jgi:hypothetical protein